MRTPSLIKEKGLETDSHQEVAFKKSEPLPLSPRLVIHGVEGWGKTTLAAHAATGLIMAPNETGYETLLSTGLVPNIPRITVKSWQDLLYGLELGLTNGYWINGASVAIDALSGMERLCQEYICKKDFNGEWGEKGFESYGKGYSATAFEWNNLISLLERINEKGVTIILLCHTQVKTFKNPIGPDFDRYTTNLNDKVWQLTKNWADAILFCNFLQIVEKDKKGRIRGKGGNDRIVYTERSDAWDAKNRFNMPSEILIPNNPSEVWETIRKEIFKELKEEKVSE